MPRRPFEEFKRPDITVLVESGTHEGDGVQEALDAGFDRVISYEISAPLISMAQERFQGMPRVSLHHKPSQTMLDELLQPELRSERMFFWLDGHYSFGNTSFHEVPCPILQELDCIAKHPVKNHTIAVDDVRLFGTSEFSGILLDHVKKKILSINKDYVFTYTDGYTQNDVMVAYIEN